MPVYRIQSPEGREVEIEGDAPPSDSDLDEIFAGLPEPAVQGGGFAPSDIRGYLNMPRIDGLEQFANPAQSQPSVFKMPTLAEDLIARKPADFTPERVPSMWTEVPKQLFTPTPESQIEIQDYPSKRAEFSPTEASEKAAQIDRTYEEMVEALGDWTGNPEKIARVNALSAWRDEEKKNLGFALVDPFSAPKFERVTPQQAATALGINPEGRTAKNIANVQGAVTGLTESFAAPEGVAMMTGPKAIAKPLATAFVGTMAKDASEQTYEAIKKYSEGDTAGGDAALTAALATSAMLGVPIVAGKGPNKAKELAKLIEKGEFKPRISASEAAILRSGLPPRIATPEMLPELQRTRELVDQAIQEATQKIVEPGKVPALELLRRQQQEIVPGEQPRVSKPETRFERPAEEVMRGRTVSEKPLTPEAPNATDTKGAEIPSNLREQPLKGQEEMPTEVSSGKTDEGRGEKVEIKPPEGERFVEIVDNDGNVTIGSFGDKTYDFTSIGKGKVPHVGRYVNGKWSHGTLGKGETIREINKEAGVTPPPTESPQSAAAASLETPASTVVPSEAVTPKVTEGKSVSEIIESGVAAIERLQKKLRNGAASGDTLMGVPSAVLDTALEIARLALKGGKTIAQATELAAKHIRHNVKGFDENKIMSGLQQIFKDEGMVPPTRKEKTPTTEVPAKAGGGIEAPKISQEEIQAAKGTKSNPIVASVKANLTSKRGLPDVAFDSWVKRQGEVQEQVNRTAHGIRELYRSLADNYGISFFRRAVKGLSDVPVQDVRLMNEYLRGNADISQIPERVRPALQNLRSHIDSLSNRMVQEGLVNDKLQLTIEKNLGSYLRRSYKVFDDPKWGLNKLTPENQQKVVSGMLEELRRDNPNATVQDALANIEAAVNEYKRTGEQGSLFGKGGTLGNKDLSLFLKRKNLSDWWKVMMGEHESPVANYAKSISKMARFVADQKFLQEVEASGVGKFLFEKPQGNHTAKISSEGNKTLEPLSKYYTTPEIAKSFREFYDKPSESSPVWRGIMAATYASKGAKTVGSLLTQARNLIGQPFFWARNGHFDVREAMPAVKAIFADVAGREGKWLEYYRDAIKHGVANESAQAGELRTVLKDVTGPRDADMPIDLLAGRSLWNTAKRATIDPAERLYRTSDEVGKLVGWEIEKWYAKKIHPEWSEAQVKQEAATRIRNLYPTYSMISRFVKSAGKQPVFGPFISFPAETIRTSYWAGKYAIEDLKSDNPWQRLRGAKALVGMTAAYGGGAALASFFRQANNVTAQQDSDVRKFMPDWSKNSQLLYLSPIKDGKAEYINLSYINPYSYLSDPITAVASMDSEGYDERFWNAVTESVRPFTSEQMGAAAVMDILRNQTKTGREVYNPEDSTLNKSADIVKHLFQPVIPGTVERFQKKILPAIKGEQPTTGQDLSLKRELTTELTGIKSEGMDFNTAISRKLRDFSKAEQNIENIWTSTLFKGGNVPPEQLESEYRRMNQLRQESQNELRESIQSAIRLGISESSINEAIAASGVSSEQRRQILSGDYKPYSPSVELFGKALQRRDIPASVFGDDVESKLKLMSAKAAKAGDEETARNFRKVLSKIDSINDRKTKVEKSPNLNSDERLEMIKALEAQKSELLKIAAESYLQ